MKQLNFLNDVHDLLEGLSSKDKNYQSLIKQVQRQCGYISTAFSTYDKRYHIATMESQKNQSAFFKNYTSLLEIASKEISIETYELKNEIVQLKNELLSNIESKKMNLHHEISDTDHQIEQEKQKHQDRLKHLKNEKLRELKLIDQEVLLIKRKHEETMLQLEREHQSSLSIIEKNYEEQLHIIDRKINETFSELENKLLKISEQKESYKKQADDNYLSIKNTYHQASTSFNKKIDALKFQRKKVHDDLQREYLELLIPIEENLKKIQDDYQLTKKEHQVIFTNSLKEHNESLDVIEKNYELEKSKINYETAEAITLLNSKLSAYKESLNTIRLENTKKLKDTLSKRPETEHEALKRQFNAKLQQQNQDLNKQIIRNAQDTKLKQKENYKRLFLCDEKYITNRKKWRIKRALLDYDYKYNSAHFEFDYQYRLREIELSLKKEKIDLDHRIKNLEILYLSDVEPFDTQLSISNIVQEREINLLTNDTSFHLANYQHEEQIAKLIAEKTKLELDFSLVELELNYIYQKNILSIETQLSSEKNIVIRDAELKKHDLRKHIVVTKFSISDMHSEDQLQTTLIELNLNKSLSKDKFRSYETTQQEITKLKIQQLENKISFLESKSSYLENEYKISRNKNSNRDELNLTHARITLLFSQLNRLYTLNHEIFSLLNSFYKIPAHPEDFKTFIDIFISLINNIQKTQKDSLDDFLVDMSTYLEQKINETTGYKFETNLATIEETYQTTVDMLDFSISKANEILKHYDNQIIIIHSKIDKIETQIFSISKALDVKLKRSEKIKLNAQRRNHLTEIKLFTKEIDKINTQMDIQNNFIDDKNKQKLVAKEEMINQINALKAQQRNDASIYFNQLSTYQTIINDFKKEIKSFNLVITNGIGKLTQALFITDIHFEQLLKKYKYFQSQYEKNVLSFYQSLLTASQRLYHFVDSNALSIFNNLLSHYNKVKSDLDKKNKSIIEEITDLSAKYQNIDDNFELNLTTLVSKSQDTYILKQTPKLNDAKESIISAESILQQVENDKNHNLELINLNLKNVLIEYKNEFDKNLSTQQHTYKKNKAKNEQQAIASSNQITQLQNVLQLKNENLLEKYIVLIQKRRQEQNEKLKLYDLNTQKELKNLNEKHKNIVDDLVKMKKYQLTKQKNLNKEKTITVKSIEKNEHSTYVKELKDAKKSFTFKCKTLNL